MVYSIENLSYISVTTWPLLLGALLFLILFKVLDRISDKKLKNINKIIKYGCGVFFVVFFVSSGFRLYDFSSNMTLIKTSNQETKVGVLKILTPKNYPGKLNNYSVYSFKVKNISLNVRSRENEAGCLSGIDIPFENDGDYVEVSYKDRGSGEPQCILEIKKTGKR